MAAAALTPRVRVMVVCDGVKPSRIEDGVFHLHGVRNYIAAASFPFLPKRLWLYLTLSSPREGKYPGYIQVVDDHADKTISYRKIHPVPVFDEGFEFLPVPVRLACEFPHPGRYLIQVWFFQEATADVIKAEQPFDVLQES
jgi:hypothetical protein